MWLRTTSAWSCSASRSRGGALKFVFSSPAANVGLSDEASPTSQTAWCRWTTLTDGLLPFLA